MPRKYTLLFDELVAKYMENHCKAKNKPQTYKENIRIYNKYLNSRFGDKYANTITKQDVQKFLSEYVSSTGHGTQGNRILALMRSVYNWGMRQDLVTANPCATVDRPGPENRRTRTLSPNEARLVWQSIDGADTSEVLKEALKLIMLTGARKNEVCGMEWREVDLVDKQWTIPGTRTKNKQSRVIPLSSEAVAVLLRCKGLKREGLNYIFPNRCLTRNKPIHGDSVWQALKKVQEVCGFDDFHVHDLRRTCGTHLRRLGLDRHTLKLVLGHSTASDVTSVYDLYSAMDEKTDILQKWSDDLTKVA